MVRPDFDFPMVDASRLKRGQNRPVPKMEHRRSCFHLVPDPQYLPDGGGPGKLILRF